MDEASLMATQSVAFHKVVGSSYQFPDARNLDDEISMNMYFEAMSKQNESESPGILRSIDGTETVESFETAGFARGLYSTYYGLNGLPELWACVGNSVYVKSANEQQPVRRLDGILSKSSDRVFFAEPGGVSRSVLILENESPTLYIAQINSSSLNRKLTTTALPKNPYRTDSAGEMEPVVSTAMASIANRIVVNDKGTGQIFISRPGAFTGTANVYQYQVIEYDGDNEHVVASGITGDELYKYTKDHPYYVSKIMYKEDGHTPDYKVVNLETSDWSWKSDTGGYQYETALSYTGDTVVAMECVNNNRLIVLGNRSYDIWELSSDSSGYYALDNSSTGNNVGCASASSVARIQSNVCWLGSGKDGYNGVWMISSEGLSKISTPALDRKLLLCNGKSSAVGFAYSYAGHSFYVLTLNEDDLTIVYDITTGFWHNRSSIKDDGTDGAWRPVYASEFAGDQYFLTYFGKELVKLSADRFTEFDGKRIRRVRRWAPITASFAPVILNEMRIECGVGLTEILQPETDGHETEGFNPQVMLRCSPDGIRYGNTVVARLGVAGSYGSECRWQQLGMGKYFVIELTFTDPASFYIFDSKIRYLATERF